MGLSEQGLGGTVPFWHDWHQMLTSLDCFYLHLQSTGSGRLLWKRTYLVEQRGLAQLEHSDLVGDVLALSDSLQLIHTAVLDIHHFTLTTHVTVMRSSVLIKVQLFTVNLSLSSYNKLYYTLLKHIFLVFYRTKELSLF